MLTYSMRLHNVPCGLQEVDKCLADGADEYLQLLSLAAVIMQQATQT